MKRLWQIAFAVVCTLLGVGLLLLTTRQPQGEPIRLLPPPTTPPLTVHITGAVNDPGVYTLPPGSRVEDAIEAAGGGTTKADTSLLNLAELVEDGMQIWVPARLEELPGNQFPGESEGEPAENPLSKLININTATQIELESLPGIGPVTAEAIIKYRNENGPFKKIEDIQEVSGIGPAKFEQIRELISIRGSPKD
jgi:competence protein ComEA